MANYRIRVERLNEQVPLLEELERSIDVDESVILGNVDEERVVSAIQNISIEELAQAIGGQDTIVHAAILSMMVCAHGEDGEDE